MNEHERLGDPAFDRLVAADPAKRAPDPVEGVLRAKVDALIAGSGAGPLAEVGAPSEPPDELAVRRHRRRTPWLVAAAVAGIVSAGGGGYLAGQSGVGSAPMVADAGAESGAESESGAASEDESGDEPSTLGMPDGPATEGLEPLDASGDLPAATGLVFHAGVGLSDMPGTAEVRTASASDGKSLGSYPVVSEVEAVERLGDPRFAGAVLGSRHARAAGEAPAGEESAGAAPVPGGPIVWPVEDVTIVAAALAEMRYTLPDGTVLFVPAYDLTDASGNGWTVMAVDEELLDFTP